MSFCSFASLVGGACGPSTENPRDVKAHLRSCNLVTNTESIDNERKLLLARAGEK